MELHPQVIIAIVGGLATVLVSVLTTLGATRATRQKDRVDMARLVDEKIAAHIERLEEEVEHQKTEIQAQAGKIHRLTLAFDACRALTYRLIDIVRRHDPDAAKDAEAAIPTLPTP